MKDKELREKFDNLKTADIRHPFSSFISLYEIIENINNEIRSINIYITGEKNISKTVKDYGTDFCSLEERMKSDRDQLDATNNHLNDAWEEINKIRGELNGINTFCNTLAKNDFVKIENRIIKPPTDSPKYSQDAIINSLIEFLQIKEAKGVMSGFPFTKSRSVNVKYLERLKADLSVHINYFIDELEVKDEKQ